MINDDGDYDMMMIMIIIIVVVVRNDSDSSDDGDDDDDDSNLDDMQRLQTRRGEARRGEDNVLSLLQRLND